MKKYIPVLLSAALLLSACGQAAEPAAASAPESTVTTTASETTAAPKTTPNGVDKAETVYAKANADGTVTETTVEAILKAREGDTIPDSAALRGILNKEGDEEYTQGEGSALTWQNHGTSITYEGKSDAALPVTTRVTYYLNGTEIAPEKLAGQSGRVRIRFDYTNHTREIVTVDRQEYTVSVPFTAVTALILDGDKFTNVEADNGKVMDLDGQTAVLGTAMPGLADSLRLTECEPLEDTDIPAYFEVSADVTDFALDFTATVLTPSALDDLDLTDLDDMDDLTDALDSLTDATDALSEGTGALADGLMTFYDGFDQYANGVKSLNEGIEALDQGLNQLYDNRNALRDGMVAINQGLMTLDGALQQVDLSSAGSGLDTAAVTDAMTGLGGDAAAVAMLPQSLTEQIMAQLDTNGVQLSEEQKTALAQSIGATIAASTTPLATDMGDKLQTIGNFAQGLSTLGDSMTQLAPQVKTLKDGVSQLAAGSGELVKGYDTYISGVLQLTQGADALAKGSAELDDASAALYGGIAELHNGAVELHDGVQEFSDKSSDELKDDFGDGLQNVLRRLKAVQQAGKGYQTFSGLADGQTGNVKFIVETAEIK